MKKILLCASNKFKNEIDAISKQLIHEGHSVSIIDSNENDLLITASNKLKIDECDVLFIVNVDFIMEDFSTIAVEYADYIGEKSVKYLSSFPDLKMICDNLLFKTKEITYELRKDISTPDSYLRAGLRKTKSEWLLDFPKAFIFHSNEWFIEVTEYSDKPNTNSIESIIVDRVFAEFGLRSMSYKEAAIKCIHEYNHDKQKKI